MKMGSVDEQNATAELPEVMMKIMRTRRIVVHMTSVTVKIS